MAARMPAIGARAVFRDRPRAPRQVLLLIVFGVLLAIVGITASSQAVMVSVYASRSTLNAVVQSDVATLRGFIHDGFDPSMLADPKPSPAELAALEGLMATLESKGEILLVELRLPDGRVIAASESAATGAVVPPGADFQRAVAAGEPQVAVVGAAASEAAAGEVLRTQSVLREYLPLRLGGNVVLVIGLWRDAVPILGGLEGLRRDVVLVTISAALIAAFTLFFVFRAAQGRLARQAVALQEASQRDPLTGTLNHGALVGMLAVQIERARANGTSLGVALIDIDGFRLLNDSHGHVAGDEALIAVAAQLGVGAADDVLIGRYGPDEFLIASTTLELDDLRAVVDGLRGRLAELALQFEATERLPITVSAGLCSYPTHASSVTALLSTAARTLEEARASGGDAVRIAQAEPEARPDGASSFDVLKGLVIAVDTKDRYTKRHSEDVARYAIFLAGCLGLDADILRTLQVAGLLHDVGKLGIPDEILRKPGRLSDAEEAIVRQHVALGDLIVRELPDIDTIRAGIRHHHERWDGKGYLDGLRGHDIPLVARILAVGDAFSAMTTTRPYRKALPVGEALRRLGDAAGSQLDEALVQAFIDGLEHAPNPPLPGEDAQLIGLWTPMRRAA